MTYYSLLLNYERRYRLANFAIHYFTENDFQILKMIYFQRVSFTPKIMEYSMWTAVSQNRHASSTINCLKMTKKCSKFTQKVINNYSHSTVQIHWFFVCASVLSTMFCSVYWFATLHPNHTTSTQQQSYQKYIIRHFQIIQPHQLKLLHLQEEHTEIYFLRVHILHTTDDVKQNQHDGPWSEDHIKLYNVMHLDPKTEPQR